MLGRTQHLSTADAVGRPLLGEAQCPCRGWSERELGKLGLGRGGGGGRSECVLGWAGEKEMTGLPLGLWGHTKPEKLVLSSPELGNFTWDRLWHTQQLEDRCFKCEHLPVTLKGFHGGGGGGRPGS